MPVECRTEEVRSISSGNPGSADGTAAREREREKVERESQTSLSSGRTAQQATQASAAGHSNRSHTLRNPAGPQQPPATHPPGRGPDTVSHGSFSAAAELDGIPMGRTDTEQSDLEDSVPWDPPAAEQTAGDDDANHDLWRPAGALTGDRAKPAGMESWDTAEIPGTDTEDEA